MLKAFYEVVLREKIRKIQIDFALGNGIYGELVGDVPVDEKLLLKVKAQMEVAGCGNPGQEAEHQHG